MKIEGLVERQVWFGFLERDVLMEIVVLLKNFMIKLQINFGKVQLVHVREELLSWNFEIILDKNNCKKKRFKQREIKKNFSSLNISNEMFKYPKK